MNKALLAVLLALALFVTVVIATVTSININRSIYGNVCSEVHPMVCYRDFIDKIHFFIYRGEEKIHVTDLWNPGIPFRYTAFRGSENSEPQDLAEPYIILFFFYDDLSEPDNFRDLIIAINPVDHPSTLGRDYVVVFFAEGAYEKRVCYEDSLIHHYKDDDPTSNYGIFASWELDEKGPCS